MNDDVLGVYFDIEDRQILLSGNITERNAREIIWALRNMERDEPRDPIDLVVHSDGGEVDSFIAIYDTIRSLDCKVNTYALGKAYSAGAMIVLGGTGTRYAYANSNIMIHEFSCGFKGRFSDTATYHEYLERLNRRIAGIISYHTKRPIDKVLQDIKNDLWLDAEGAKAYGIVDEII